MQIVIATHMTSQGHLLEPVVTATEHVGLDLAFDSAQTCPHALTPYGRPILTALQSNSGCKCHAFGSQHVLCCTRLTVRLERVDIYA